MSIIARHQTMVDPNVYIWPCSVLVKCLIEEEASIGYPAMFTFFPSSFNLLNFTDSFSLRSTSFTPVHLNLNPKRRHCKPTHSGWFVGYSDALFDMNESQQIHGLIKTRPNLLTAQETHSFLSPDHDLKGVIDSLLTTTHPKYMSDFEPKVRLLLDIGIPMERLPYVLNNVNLTKALCFKSLQDIQRMLSFLAKFGGVDLILARPAILNFDLDSQLLPRIEFLLNMSGGDEAATTTVLLKLPFILAYSVDHYTNHVGFFRSFAGLSDEEIFKIITVYPSLFSASRERKLHPRIQFLKQCGFTSNDIYKLLIKAPLFLSLSFEDNLAHKLLLLLKIGYQHGTKELGLAMGWVCRTSCKNMQEVISLFLNYGLTCEEILAMGKKHPQVLQYNHKSMKQKLDYLTQEMGYEVREILAFPAFLGYGFHGRIKHRFEAAGKNSGEAISINKLFSMSTARFSKKMPAAITIS
ncbi:hypothetical protein E3N88_03645 [Mikania micrantha]|uniref:Uncharacterized protein n=1 Tax=Mikania micrantha TaxID=192012 RepID=A0A5N6Q786_9ASTR|nr:hypothetical protein E3N88_03645 [Mikania micrantha]